MMAFSFDLTPFFGSFAASISPSPLAARQGVEQGVRLVRNTRPRYFRVLPCAMPSLKSFNEFNFR